MNMWRSQLQPHGKKRGANSSRFPVARENPGNFPVCMLEIPSSRDYSEINHIHDGRYFASSRAHVMNVH